MQLKKQERMQLIVCRAWQVVQIELCREVHAATAVQAYIAAEGVALVLATAKNDDNLSGLISTDVRESACRESADMLDCNQAVVVSRDQVNAPHSLSTCAHTQDEDG